MTAPAPTFDANREWRNFHRTYRHDNRGSFDLHFPRLGENGLTSIADLVETARQMRALVGRARREGVPVRAVGSRWSLSQAPATDGWAINTNRLRGWMRVAPASLHAGYPGTPDQRTGLFLFQCGNTVADVNEIVEDRRHGRALFTSGAANGQTIVGATATGTHGSALDHGALHDHVVAIHLIATGDRHYWIERKSRPVMKDSFAARLGATVWRDDDLFDAAVVSFGSFGVIAAVVLETVPRYLLRTHTAVRTLDEPMWRAIAALDFSADPMFGGRRPYFFQAVINPNNREVLASANTRHPIDPAYIPRYGLRQQDGVAGPGFDTLSLVGKVLAAFPGLVPPFASIAARQLFDMDPIDGTPGQVYGYKAPQLHVASGSIAVDLANARPALEALIALYREVGPVPLVLGCRYVRKSPALLAFNRFPVGLMVSIDGVDNGPSRAYFAAAADRMEVLRIPFTQHWGKTNAYTPARVRAAYGADVVDRWRAARRMVLPDATDRALFDNAYIRERGLA